jgi:hypothetical protein
MAITKRNISDDIINLLTRFKLTDDSRFATIDQWLSWKIDQVRAQLIIKQYNETGVLDNSWLTDLGLVGFHEVNFADDPNVTYCKCDISKTFIPSVVELASPSGGNPDLGLYSIISTCGKNEYYSYPMTTWRNIPSEHTRSKFHYYQRKNTELYVNKKVQNLLITAILNNPAEGYIISSTPVTTIATGTTYIVKFNQIVYNGTVYRPDDTFVGVASATTFSGTGKVVLQDQLTALDETQPYPVSGDMARMITLEILTKEFGIESKQITDIQNDSADDEQKSEAGNR